MKRSQVAKRLRRYLSALPVNASGARLPRRAPKRFDSGFGLAAVKGEGGVVMFDTVHHVRSRRFEMLAEHDQPCADGTVTGFVVVVERLR